MLVMVGRLDEGMSHLILLAVPFGPFLAWKRGDLLGALQRLYVAAALSLVLGLGLWYAQNGGPVMAVAGLALAFFVMGGAIADLWYRAGFGKHPLSTAWSRLKGLPRSAFGTALERVSLKVGARQPVEAPKEAAAPVATKDQPASATATAPTACATARSSRCWWTTSRW